MICILQNGEVVNEMFETIISDNSYLRNNHRARTRSHSSVSPDRRGRHRRISPPAKSSRRRSVSRERRSRRSSSGERRPRRRSSSRSRSQRKYSPSMSSTSSSQSSRSTSKTRQGASERSPNKIATKPPADRPKAKLVVNDRLTEEIAKQVQVILQKSKEVTDKHHPKQEAEKVSSHYLCFEHSLKVCPLLTCIAFFGVSCIFLLLKFCMAQITT